MAIKNATVTATKCGEVVLQRQIPTSYGDEPLFTAYQAVGDQEIIDELARQIRLVYETPVGYLTLREGDRWKASAGDYRVVIVK
ncbi:hypothetical protein ACFWCF_12555 [Rhodococcus sp. NPDC060090]|uniref:hypothetical protein n=1 Tax=Rhodococcus sp. NPDC060090 TaxID=3347056 RepID=UPI0036471C79